MFLKKLHIILFMLLALPVVAQNNYSKEEIDLKLILQEERIKSKLEGVEYENNAIDAKLAAQDKQIAYQDKQIENLKYIFGIVLSLIGIAVAATAFFINRRNQERFKDLENELKTAKDDALQELNRIKEIANLEIRMAKTELKEIKLEQQEKKTGNIST